MSMYKLWASFKPTAEILSYVGSVGELFYSDQDPRLRISDGSTPGGLIIGGGGGGSVNLSFITENVLPATSNTYSLGNETKSWKVLYLGEEGVYVGNKVIKLDNNDELVLPVGTRITQDDGTSIPVGVVQDLYLEDLVNTDMTQAVEGSLLQLKNGNWSATNVIDTQSGDLTITGEIY